MVEKEIKFRNSEEKIGKREIEEGKRGQTKGPSPFFESPCAHITFSCASQGSRNKK